MTHDEAFREWWKSTMWTGENWSRNEVLITAKFAFDAGVAYAAQVCREACKHRKWVIQHALENVADRLSPAAPATSSAPASSPDCSPAPTAIAPPSAP